MGNDLYIVGGTNTAMRFGNLHKYEFETNKWSYMNFENHKKFLIDYFNIYINKKGKKRTFFLKDVFVIAL